MKPSDLKQILELLDQKLEEKLNQKLDPIQKELKKHGKLLNSLKKDQRIMLDMLDREQMNQSKRIKRIEKHLEISPLAS